VARPSTVLVTEMGTGAFLVRDYQTGTSAYLGPADSDALRDAFDAAFGGVGMAMNVPPIVRPRV